MAAIDPDQFLAVESLAGEVPTLVLRGELDSSNVNVLEREVAAVLAAQPARVVFDVSELAFIDSAGLAVLVTTAGRVAHVAVRNPSPILRRVLAATGLIDLLGIEP